MRFRNKHIKTALIFWNYFQSNKGFSILVFLTIFILIISLTLDNGGLSKFVVEIRANLIASIIIYFLVERKINKLSDIPVDWDGKNDEIFEKFNETRSSIKILRISINDYMDNDKFRSAIAKAAKRIKMIEILLLHPDTYAGEKHSVDLTKNTRHRLDDMKKGLGKLDNFLAGLGEERERIKVKLCRVDPMVLYTSWDSNAMFKLNNPINPEDSSYMVETTTPLFSTFIKYFKSLWDNESVDVKDYLYVTIDATNHKDVIESRINDFYWGGNSDKREFPRFITGKDNHQLLEKISKEKMPIIVLHDNQKNMGVLSLIDSSRDIDKYEFAKKQINKTYGGEKKELNNAKYEIDYFYEKRQVLLDNKNLLYKKIKNDGYAFVSHNYYDITISQRLLNSLGSIYYCFDNYTEKDNYDDSSYFFRKKLFGQFEVTFDNGITEVSLLRNNKYKDRQFRTLSELIENENLDETEKGHLEKFKKFLISTVKDDFHYILGTEEYIKHNNTYLVYFHCICTEVTQNLKESESKQSVYEDPPHEYQIIHLVKKENVFGGNERVLDQDDSEIDRFLLEKPLDSIFYKVDLNKRKVKTGSISLDLSQSGKMNGYRDVLILEIAPKHES